jgi:hypothetical protein
MAKKAIKLGKKEGERIDSFRSRQRGASLAGLGFAGAAAVAASAGSARGDLIKLDSFAPLIGDYGHLTYNTPWDGQSFQVYNPASGMNEVPSERFHFGWISEAPSGEILFDGFAVNGKYGNDFIDGFYSEDLADGYVPEDLILVRDGNDDGPGYFDTTSAKIVPGSDDVYYFSDDILFGENLVRGDTSQIAVNANPALQPQMILNPEVPEPSGLVLMVAVGAALLKKGRGKKTIKVPKR